MFLVGYQVPGIYTTAVVRSRSVVVLLSTVLAWVRILYICWCLLSYLLSMCPITPCVPLSPIGRPKSVLFTLCFWARTMKRTLQHTGRTMKRPLQQIFTLFWWLNALSRGGNYYLEQPNTEPHCHGVATVLLTSLGPIYMGTSNDKVGLIHHLRAWKRLTTSWGALRAPNLPPCPITFTARCCNYYCVSSLFPYTGNP